MSRYDLLGGNVPTRESRLDHIGILLACASDLVGKMCNPGQQYAYGATDEMAPFAEFEQRTGNTPEDTLQKILGHLVEHAKRIPA